MDDQSDDRKTPRRLEILSGGAVRRRWPDALKGQIVMESFAPGVVVTELARRHGARASQIHAWRKAVREGRLALPAEIGPAFAPVVMTGPPPRKDAARVRPTPPMVEAAITIELGAIRVEAGADASPAALAAIVRALKDQP